MNPQHDEPCMNCKLWSRKRGCTKGEYDSTTMQIFGYCPRAKENEIKKPLTPNDMIIYIVRKEEIWDGETWNVTHGAFHDIEDARAELKRVRKTLKDWEGETIDEDSEDAFYAYREGEYLYYHCNLYIETAELK